MPFKERIEMIKNIKYVDVVFPCVDKDQTVCETLKKLKPDIFANGGDRKNADDIPEAKVCKKLGIKMVFNVGGSKKQSSSWLVNKVKETLPSEDRQWGRFKVLYQKGNVTVKEIVVNPKQRLSLQSHRKRKEFW